MLLFLPTRLVNHTGIDLEIQLLNCSIVYVLCPVANISFLFSMTQVNSILNPALCTTN